MTPAEITLLDGAMGTELRAGGVRVRDYKSSLWSALACVEAPDAVTRLHRDYIEAGADIITVNNLAVTLLLVNCTGCKAVTNAIRMLRPLTDLRIGGHANPVLQEPPGGEPELVPTDSIGPAEYAQAASGWIADGATVIGGCCDTNPDDVAALQAACA